MKAHLFNLFLIFFFASLFMVWWNTQDIKQRAIRAVQKHCDEMGVQLLDETIYLRKFRLVPNHAKLVVLSRCFGFEFSTTGSTRYRGEVIFIGKRLIEINLEPHRI